jgi:glyoxylase-like metal-dependent hydrolase (beta-lactamase superfamily II)
MHISAPKYDTAIWAGDDQDIIYTHPSGVKMQLPIVTFHTPGHTPDSLTWYDTQERVLYVGDSFYDQMSPDSDNAPWGPEGPAPILFPNEGSLVDWWCSVDRLVAFVITKNAEAEGARVKLAAGHVTSNADAGMFLIDVKDFVARVLRNVLSFEERPAKRGERFGMWSESGGGRFSLGAPVRLVEEGREKIPRVEWRC